MKLAFIMPTEAERRRIAVARETIRQMRPDQIKHVEHLLRSWNIFDRNDSLEIMWRAIKRTRRDRP